MRKLLLLLATGYWLLAVITIPIFAQEEKILPSPSRRVSEPEAKSKIDEIKEKIASTVAELNLVSKKAFVGEITRLEKNQISIDKNGETKILEVDELTKYIAVDEDNKRGEIKFSNLSIGNRILAIGLYNKDSRKLLARIIMLKNIPANITGVVREVDIKDGTITVEERKKSKTLIIDIEKTTKISLYSMGGGIAKSGLSKIEIGQRAHVFGNLNEEEEDRIGALRILLLPARTIISPTNEVVKEATQSATPTPTTKPTATPRPTRKPTTTPTPSEQIP